MLHTEETIAHTYTYIMHIEAILSQTTAMQMLGTSSLSVAISKRHLAESDGCET